MRFPPVSLVRQNDTHRWIPSRYRSKSRTPLDRLAADNAMLGDLQELTAATDEQAQAARNLLPGIGIDELVFGVPEGAVINATFCHAHPMGSRFNGPERGAWYAGFERETSEAEVIFHRTVQLAEIDRYIDEVDYDDYLADFSASLHDLRAPSADGRRLSSVLAEDSYLASQDLAASLLEAGSLGIVFPSVRRLGGTCLVCFRPALIMNVRCDATYRLTWSGSPTPEVTVVPKPAEAKPRPRVQ